MRVYIKYSELQIGDFFIIDPMTDGRIGIVLGITHHRSAVDISYLDMIDKTSFSRLFNIAHITKYLRPGETDPRLNIGIG